MNILKKGMLLMVIISTLCIAEGLKNPFKWVFTKVKSCTPIIPLATRVTAQRASYEMKKRFLDLGDKLAILDPRITSLAVAQETAEAVLTTAEQTLRAAQTTLNIAEKGAEGLSKLSRLIGRVSGNAFNIKRAYFEGYARDIKTNGPVVRLAFDAIIGGQPVSLQPISFNLMLPEDSVRDLIMKIALSL